MDNGLSGISGLVVYMAYGARRVCGAVAPHACLAVDNGLSGICGLVVYMAYGARRVCGAVAPHACLAVDCCLFLFIGRIVSTFCNGLQSFSGSFSVCCLFVKSYLMFCSYCVWNNVLNVSGFAFCVLLLYFSFVVFRVFHLFLSVSGTFCNGLFWFSVSFVGCW